MADNNQNWRYHKAKTGEFFQVRRNFKEITLIWKAHKDNLNSFENEFFIQDIATKCVLKHREWWLKQFLSWGCIVKMESDQVHQSWLYSFRISLTADYADGKIWVKKVDKLLEWIEVFLNFNRFFLWYFLSCKIKNNWIRCYRHLFLVLIL